VSPVRNQFDTIVQRMSAAVSFSQVHLKMNQKPVSPLCSGLAAVQMRNGLISMSVGRHHRRSPQWVTSDWFDHECPEVVSESGTGGSKPPLMES
jgi:hypothetical protein